MRAATSSTGTASPAVFAVAFSSASFAACDSFGYTDDGCCADVSGARP
ncbi:hypothetical protein [Kineococcus siccus]|nr:hypothetical protein [Kineococcus siccus]